MPPEPQDTTDPAHPEVVLAYEEELATYSRLLRAMARRSVAAKADVRNSRANADGWRKRWERDDQISQARRAALEKLLLDDATAVAEVARLRAELARARGDSATAVREWMKGREFEPEDDAPAEARDTGTGDRDGHWTVELREPLTDRQIAALARKLAALLEDDEGRGMASWHIAVARLGRELHDALGSALAGDDDRDGGARHRCGCGEVSIPSMAESVDRGGTRHRFARPCYVLDPSPVPPAPDEARDAGRNLKIGDQVRWIAWDEGGWEGPASAEDWSTEETGFVEWISLPKVRVNCDTGPRRVTLPVAVLAVSASTPEEATDDHE